MSQEEAIKYLPDHIHPNGTSLMSITNPLGPYQEAILDQLENKSKGDVFLPQINTLQKTMLAYRLSKAPHFLVVGPWGPLLKDPHSPDPRIKATITRRRFYYFRKAALVIESQITNILLFLILLHDVEET